MCHDGPEYKEEAVKKVTETQREEDAEILQKPT